MAQRSPTDEQFNKPVEERLIVFRNAERLFLTDGQPVESGIPHFFVMSFTDNRAVYPDDLTTIFPVFRINGEHYLRVLCLRGATGLRALVV